MCMSLTYVIDFDSTLVSVESLDELVRISTASTPGVDALLEEFAEITSQAMDGSLPFSEALRQRMALLEADYEDVEQLIEELKDMITDSAREHKEWFEEHADSIYVVSGGFEDYIVPVMEELGISRSHIFANRFVYDENHRIIAHDSTLYLSKAQGKPTQVKALELTGPVIMIGDGMTDYEVRSNGEADEFWAFTQHVVRSSVVERADRVLTSFSEIETLTELATQNLAANLV